MFDLSPDFDIRVRGRSLRAETPWSDLNLSWSWPGGPNEVTFTCATTYGTRIASLLRSAPVEVVWAGWVIWAGTILEPEWDGSQVRVAAEGAFKEGVGYAPLNGFNQPTDNAGEATAWAIARGLNWVHDSSVPSDSLGSTSVYANVNGVLDDRAAKDGLRWAVNAQRVAYMAADPTDVSYHVRAGAADLGIATDSYASHVVLLYNDSTSGIVESVAYPDFSAPPTVYEQTYGHAEWMTDKTDLAPMSNADALGIAQAVYERTMQKPGYTNGLQLAQGEILDAGWQPIHPARVAAESWGKVVRCHGVPDMALATPYTDFVVGSTAYQAGSSQVTVNPVGLAARDQETVLTEIIEAMVKGGTLLGEAA